MEENSTGFFANKKIKFSEAVADEQKLKQQLKQSISPLSQQDFNLRLAKAILENDLVTFELIKELIDSGQKKVTPEFFWYYLDRDYYEKNSEAKFEKISIDKHYIKSLNPSQNIFIPEKVKKFTELESLQRNEEVEYYFNGFSLLYIVLDRRQEKIYRFLMDLAAKYKANPDFTQYVLADQQVAECYNGWYKIWLNFGYGVCESYEIYLTPLYAALKNRLFYIAKELHLAGAWLPVYDDHFHEFSYEHDGYQNDQVIVLNWYQQLRSEIEQEKDEEIKQLKSELAKSMHTVQELTQQLNTMDLAETTSVAKPPI